jgi:imidazolonepropionase-like amidohydrolase
VNASLCKAAGKVGTLEPGAHADIVLVRANPLDDITVLADPQKSLSHVVKAGHVVARA